MFMIREISFFFASRRWHTRLQGDWSSDVCSSDLDEVADTILPETKTPGAKAAKVGSFMAVMVTDTYDDQQQAIFRDGMRKVNDAGFMTKSPAERLAFLEQLDREQKAYMDTRAQGAPAHYFRLMKELTLYGYFT